MEQRSEEWFKDRLGKVTASRVADIMAKTKSGYSASRANYMAELLNERLTGQRKEGFTSPDMQRGIELEPIARSAYEILTGYTVKEVGLIMHESGMAFGASPDGLIESTSGALEIKCPNPANHMDTILSGTYPSKYQWQLMAQMACTGALWVDFVSFNNEMPEQLQIKVIRVVRNEMAIIDMIREIKLFLDELDELEQKTALLIADGINNEYIEGLKSAV